MCYNIDTAKGKHPKNRKDQKMKLYTIRYWDISEEDYESNNYGEAQIEELGEGYTLADFYSDRAGISLDELDNGGYSYVTESDEKRYIVIAGETYIIRDREAGNKIAEFGTFEKALNALKGFEEDDEKDGTYTPDFYEIYDTVKEEIVY